MKMIKEYKGYVTKNTIRRQHWNGNTKFPNLAKVHQGKNGNKRSA